MAQRRARFQGSKTVWLEDTKATPRWKASRCGKSRTASRQKVSRRKMSRRTAAKKIDHNVETTTIDVFDNRPCKYALAKETNEGLELGCLEADAAHGNNKEKDGLY